MSFLKEHAISNPVVAGVSAAAPKEKGLFSTIMDNVAGGAESVIGGGLDYIGAQLKRFDEAGRESSYVDSIRNSDEGTLGKWGDSFINNGEYLNDKAAKNFAESGTLDKYQDMSIIDRLTSADYLTDKRGLLADFSQMAGSAIPFAAASAAAPFGGAGALAARGIGSMAARAGAKQIGKAIMSKAGQQAGASAAKWALGTGPLEAATNAGGMYADLKYEGLSDDEIARRMNSMIQEELPMDMLTQGIMGPILEGKGFKPIFKRGGRSGKIAGYGVNIPGSAASEYAQEMTQQQAQNKWSGKPYGTFFNPTEDEQQAGRAAFMGSLPLGLFGAGHTAYRDYKARINRMNNEAAKSNPNNPFNGMEETAGNKTEIADVPESTVTVQRGNANNGGSDKEAFFNAIEMQESGGDPDAVSSTGARGVYQIQPENWDAWSKEAGLGGASMDDDDAYRQVGRFKMGQYFDEYGPEGALVAWYSGPNNAQRWVDGEATDQNGRPWDAPQGNGPSIAGYVNSAMGHFADEKAQSPALDIPQTADYTISGEVSNPNLTDLTEQKLRLLDRDYYNQYGRHFYITSMARNGGGESWHDSAQAFDTADDFLEGNADARNWLIDKAKEYGLYGLDEYSNPSANATGGHLHFSDHGEALNGSGGSYNITVPGFNLSQYDLTPEQEKANIEAAQALISNNEVTPEQQQSVMEMATQLMNMPVSDDVNEDAAHAAAMQNAIDGGDIGAIFKMHPQDTANAMMKTVMAAKAPSPRRAPATPKIDNINPQAPAQTRVSTNYGNRFAQTVDDITKLASQGKIAEAALVARSNGWNNTMVNLLTQGVNASAGNIQNAIMNGIQLDVPNAFPALPEGQGLAGNIKNNQQQISIANLEDLASIANNNPQYAAAQATQQNLPMTASAIMQSAMNGQPIDSGLLDSTIQQDLTNNQRQANANRQAIDARMQKAGLATNPAAPNAGIIVPNGAPAETPDIVVPDTPKRKAPTVNTNDPMARLNDSPVFRQAKAKGDIGTMANEADAMGFHKEAEQIRNSQYGNVPSKFDYKKRLSEVKKMSRADRIELGKELLNELEAKNIPVNDNLRNDLEHGVPKAIVNAEKKLANAETNDEAEQEVKPAEEATPAIANNEAAENTESEQHFTLGTHEDTRPNVDKLYSTARPTEYLGDKYRSISNLAKEHNGHYSKYANNSFIFENENDRNEFVKEADALLAESKLSAKGRADDILNNIQPIATAKLTNQEQALVALGEKMGVPVKFFTGVSRLNGFHSNGMTFINRNGFKSINWTFWHETLHWLKNNNKALYDEIIREIKAKQAFTKEQLDAYRKSIGRNMSDDETIEEMVADKMPDVYSRVKLFKDLANENPTLCQRLLAWVRHTLDKLKEIISADKKKAGLHAKQVDAMIEAFTRLAGDLRSSDGKKLVEKINKGKDIRIVDSKDNVLYPIDNLKNKTYNAGKSLTDAQKTTLFNSIQTRIDDHIANEEQSGKSIDDICAELTSDYSAHREGIINRYKSQYKLFLARINDSDFKREQIDRIYPANKIADKDVDKVYNGFLNSLKGVADYAGILYREIAFDRRRNNGRGDKVFHWESAERQRAERKRQQNNNKFSVSRSDKDGFSDVRYFFSESEKAGTVDSFNLTREKSSTS